MPLRDDRIAEVAEVRAALRSGVAALAEREERLRLATEGTGMATWDLDVQSGVMVWSPLGYRMLGLAERPAVAPTLALWRDRVHPEDLPHLETALRTAVTAGAFHCVYRIRRADDGAERWLETFGRLLDAGPGGRMIGVAFDVTERREAEEQRVLLMREVDHRAKNVLAVVQAVVRLTRADEPAAFARTIEGRVLALARAHELLARDQWQGAGLRELAARELEGPLESGAARIDGPNLQLKPAAVQPMAMVLHELATNAAKHGALSREGGRVDLGWRTTEAGRLALRWVERGGPQVAGAPRSVSFGWRMITATVQGQLSGALSADWSPEGLSVTIEIDPSLYAAAGPRAVPGGAGETGGASTAVSDSLRGRRILVAEDEALIAADVAATLRAAGAVVVGPAATVDEGRALVATAGALDAAVLDLDLRGELAIPLAEALDAHGVPVVVLSAFDDLDRAARWPGGAPVATLRKPAAAEAIVAALVRAVDGRAAARESSRPR